MSLERSCPIEFSARNIGGLDTLKTTIKPGLNIVEEPNASGKTSFLRAFSLLITPSGHHKEMEHFLRINADQGNVSIKNQSGETFQKTITKDRNTVIVDGDEAIKPELSNLVKNFAIGGSDNKILTAIRNGENLKELLTNDFNTEQMKQRIRKSEEKVNLLELELNKLKEHSSKLPALATKKEKIEKDLKKLVEERTALEEEMSNFTQTKGNDNNSAEFQKLTAQFQEINLKISNTEKLIDKDKESIAQSKKSIETISKQTQNDKGSLKKKISSIDKEIQKLSSSLTPLRRNFDSISLFLDGTQKILKILDISNYESNNGVQKTDILDSLTESQAPASSKNFACPCCGQDTEISILEKHTGEIRNEFNKLKREIKDIKDQIDSLEKSKGKLAQEEASFRALVSKEKDMKMRISQIESNINVRQNALSKLQEDKDAVKSKLNKISSNIDTKQQETSSKLEKINQDIGTLKSILKDLVETIDIAKKRSEKIHALETDYQSAVKKMNQTKSDLQHKEQRLLSLFNETIEKVYSKLDFDINIWKITLRANYEIQVMRNGDNGQPLLDGLSVKTLSKSEIEVIGLVVMLSGYIINDIHKIFPYILLDELTYLDNARLKDLMSFMSNHTTSIILTKLPQENGPIADSQIKVRMA